MKRRLPHFALLAALAWLALAGAAFGQLDYPAEIAKTGALLKANPASQVNRVRLATLYYLHGSQQSRSGQQTAAIESYRSGLATVEEKGQAIPHTHTVYQALWYGLGYSLRLSGQRVRAVPVLEQLASTFPRLAKGRYLLGVTLVESGKASNMSHGVEVLTQLAGEDPGTLGQMARRTALRWAYNYGTVLVTEGKADQAARIMLGLNRTAGAEGAATPEEQQHLLYGAGYFKVRGGSTPDGIADLEVLRDLNPDYKLHNGITVRAVLANAYYQGGLEQVQNSGLEALKLSVEYFDQAEKSGNPRAADVNYGRAVAYLKMGKGQEANVAKELDLLSQKDPDLYRRVNQGK